MNTKRSAWIGCGTLAILALLTWLAWPTPSPRSQITKQLNSLMEMAKKNGEAVNNPETKNPMQLLGNASHGMNMAEHFTEQAHVEVSPVLSVVQNRRKLAALLTRLRMGADTIDLQYEVLQLAIESPPKSARMKLKSNVTYTRGGRTRKVQHTHRLKWAERDGVWLIRNARVIDE